MGSTYISAPPVGPNFRGVSISAADVRREFLGASVSGLDVCRDFRGASTSAPDVGRDFGGACYDLEGGGSRSRFFSNLAAQNPNIHGAGRQRRFALGCSNGCRPRKAVGVENPWSAPSSWMRPGTLTLKKFRFDSNGGGNEAFVESGTAAYDAPFSGEEKAAQQNVDGSILTGDGSELQSTLRLVECAMLAATAGLAFFLSNLFRLEAYLGCFFPLPVVISSMRWGAAAGRKTMVATAMLLLMLSGPLKAASYLLMHGFVGLAIGSLWRWRSNWILSIAVCTLVRCFGAMGFVLLSSWLLRENLLALITVNAHASFSYMLAALGINIVPTMLAIYFVFAGLLFVNCGSFVFLLHVLYAIFLRRLGIPMSIAVPGWIERAM